MAEFYYPLLFLHLLSLVIGFGAVMVIDSFGLLWIFKRVRLSTVMRTADVTQRLIWIGWTGLVFSGSGLLIIRGSIDQALIIKLFFVALLGLNGVYLHFIKSGFSGIADDQPLPALYYFRITLASSVSQLGWWGAMLIGFLHHNWRHVIPWPPHPATAIGVMLGAILALAISGEIFFRNRHEAADLSRK